MSYLQASGPLYGDIDVINFTLAEFLDQQIDDGKIQRTCTTCGFPDCNCAKCIFINERRQLKQCKSKCSVPHTCKISSSGFTGGQPPAAGYYAANGNQELQQAWEAVGSSTMPVFIKSKNGSGYFWPEQLQEDE